MKNVIILGSAGSIGSQTLDILDSMADIFSVYGLATFNEAETLAEQTVKFRPKAVALVDESALGRYKGLLAGRVPEILVGSEGVAELASRAEADIVVNAIVGAAGLVPSIRAVRPGARLCTANKESLVIAGHILMPLVRERGAELIPIDSEHSALLQASLAGKNSEIRRLIITASGGPFWRSEVDLDFVTPEMALRHPKWRMGPKISIDSATMMNKGLEVIEARWLFDIPAERIDVLVHPQSIVHSIVEFIDGSQIAQAGMPDMHLPIQYALTFPERLDSPAKALNLAEISSLTFEMPDFRRFPALPLAYKALAAGGTAPCVMNSANEAAVQLFLDRKIAFTDIFKIVDRALAEHCVSPKPSIDEVLALDKEIRERTFRDHDRF